MNEGFTQLLEQQELDCSRTLAALQAVDSAAAQAAATLPKPVAAKKRARESASEPEAERKPNWTVQRARTHAAAVNESFRRQKLPVEWPARLKELLRVTPSLAYRGSNICPAVRLPLVSDVCGEPLPDLISFVTRSFCGTNCRSGHAERYCDKHGRGGILPRPYTVFTSRLKSENEWLEGASPLLPSNFAAHNTPITYSCDSLLGLHGGLAGCAHLAPHPPRQVVKPLESITKVKLLINRERLSRLLEE